MEGKNTKWSPDNWLQETEENKFAKVYEE
ncbi:hypothetical protein ANCCAN_27203 [Ancylostoma caninum]|uniref:Uncharacterized protein n=1 Tax=Ancylostoma caninum TaxID=29170 RepID=A0A368F4L2_ANCCA|nr:hypothetical protein ANCCAN_27203 [Ancylostoma caninum]